MRPPVARDVSRTRQARAQRVSRFAPVPLLLLMIFSFGILVADAKPRAPQVAPAFTLPARDGTVALDSLRGRVVLLDFWASWCEPCKRSFPWMNSLVQRYGARGLSVVAINLDKDRDLADRFVEEHEPAFTIAFDPAGTTAEAYRVAAMPSSYLVGRDGTILSAHLGFDAKKASEFEKQIAAQLTP
ncbi:MAG TPA: TlpA disulfide reductase family protein [Candidatus Udaeobacter sp.]|nr:TlpA disulfide reductase family protein [Candidatus Udaeobacter sp.]